MGADLIGYQVMLPEKLTDDEKEKCKEHLDKLEKLIRSPNFIQNLAKEKSGDDLILGQLNELAPSLTYEIDYLSYSDDPEDLEELEEHFKDALLAIPKARKFLDKIEIEGRDVAWRYYTLLGRKFVGIFAGCESWGDEPEGLGYQTLKDLDKTGILNFIENLTIPSESLSIQFVKS